MREAAKNSVHSQEYLSLLARKGGLEAITRGRNWYITHKAVETYSQEVKKNKPV